MSITPSMLRKPRRGTGSVTPVPIPNQTVPPTSSLTQEQDDADVAKKKARVAEIIAANRKKRQSKGTKKSNVSAEGVVSPILYSYPSSYADQPSTSAGFSMSDIPSIVWIILAVAGGWFLIKSARKR